MAIKTGGAVTGTPTIANTAVDNLRNKLPVEQGSTEPTYNEVTNQSQEDMSWLMNEVETTEDQTPPAPTPKDLTRRQESVSSVAVDISNDGEVKVEPFGEQTRYDRLPNSQEIGDYEDLNGRITKIVNNFLVKDNYFGTTPAPEGAPPRIIPQALSKLGVPDNQIGNFLAVASVVTEKSLHEAMVASDKDAFDYLDESLGNFSKVESMEPEQIKPEAEFTKNNLNLRLGRAIGEEFQRFKTGGEDSQSNLSKDEAIAIGDAMLELYASNNPDIIERGLADVEGVKRTTVFRVTAHGADVLNKDTKVRNRILPKGLLKARKTPETLAGPDTRITGQLNYKGGKILREALKNLGSIGNAVIPRRGKILLMTLMPALSGRNDAVSQMSSEINNMGSKKIGELVARANIKGLNDSDKERYVNSAMNAIKDTAANSLFGLASERRGANYLDYYITAFNNRIAPMQTLLDPTSFKQVRFVLGNPTPVLIKMGSRQERNYRQMIAMHLVPDGDGALPMERERLLKSYHSKLYSYGQRLRELVDSMDNNTYEAAMDAVENLTPITDPKLQGIKGLGLDPEGDAELIELIRGKEEDGMLYIDGLIDYANYYDALYNPNARGRKPQFATYFNAYMDGKTNGLAANALVLGIKRLAYATGVLRDNNTDLLDNGDIRADVHRTFDAMITDHDFQLDEDTNIALRQIAKIVLEDKQLSKKMHKDATMTYGYGIDPVAFTMYIDRAIQGVIAKGNNELQTLYETVESSLSSTNMKSPLSSLTAKLINTVYENAVVNSLSPEMLESRKLMKSIALNHGFTDTLFQIDGPLGPLMKLSFGGKIMQDYDSASKIRYSRYEANEETGDVERKPTTAIKYEVDRLSSAAPKTNFMGEEVYGLQGANGSVVGAVQAIDSATLLKLLSGKSWQRLMSASNGSPYLHTIHDAIKVDANSYDVVLNEVNRIWTETSMNYNYVEQAHKALNDNMDKFYKELKELPSNSKVNIGPGSKYQMVQYALRPVEKKSNEGKVYTVYPNLERYLKLAGVNKDDIRRKAWDLVKAVGIKPVKTKTGEFEILTEIFPAQLRMFVDKFNRTIDIEKRLDTLEKTIDSNKKQLYPLIAKLDDKGRWVATADNIYQYYSH